MTKKSTFSVPLEAIKYAKYISVKTDQLKDETHDENMNSLNHLLFSLDIKHGINFGWKMSSIFSDTYAMGLSDIKVRNIITKHLEKYLHFDISIADNTKVLETAWKISYTNHNNNKIIPIKRNILLFSEKKLEGQHPSNKAFYDMLKKEKQKQN